MPTIRYQYREHLGSSTVEANENGQMISYEEYYPYGASAYRAAAFGVDLSLKRYRFTGKERDEETGLDYFGVRHYASWLGRWTSGDPGGFVDGLNLYRYVRNNPVNGIDREGYETEPPPGTYTVKKDDSPEKIANEFGISVWDLARLNQGTQEGGGHFNPIGDGDYGRYWSEGKGTEWSLRAGDILVVDESVQPKRVGNLLIYPDGVNIEEDATNLDNYNQYRELEDHEKNAEHNLDVLFNFGELYVETSVLEFGLKPRVRPRLPRGGKPMSQQKLDSRRAARDKARAAESNSSKPKAKKPTSSTADEVYEEFSATNSVSSISTADKAFDIKIADATEAQLGAIDHAFKRHGKELSELIGKPIQWTKKAKLQPMLDNFNEAVYLIRTQGKLVGQKTVPFQVKGSGKDAVATLSNVYKYKKDNGSIYYLYERSSDSRFVSAGYDKFQSMTKF